MTVQIREIRRSLGAYPGFATALLIALGLAGLIGLMTFVMMLRPGFLGMGHFSKASHRVHDVTYGFLFATAVVGMLAQLRRPSQNHGGMLMALIPWMALLLAAVVSTSAGVALSSERILVAAGTVTAAMLYPARGELFRSIRLAKVNRVMLALVIIAAVPLIAFASNNIGLQRSASDVHAASGHYGFMAAFAFTVIAVGLLASLRPAGFRLVAWVAGLLSALLALASRLNPDSSSSLSLGWSLAAIAWGGIFIAAAHLTKDAGLVPQPVGSRVGSLDAVAVSDTSGSSEIKPRTGARRRVKAFGIVAGILILLIVVIARVTGQGGHGAASSVAEGAIEISVTANNLSFDPKEITVTTGEDVAIVLTSVDTLHDFTIDEFEAHVAAEKGTTKRGGFRAGKPGRYIFYCGEPGHRQADMEGTLIVDSG